MNNIQDLISYLDSIDYQITEEQINTLLDNKELPHLRPFRHMLVFNLDHIDWWVNQQRKL